MFGHSHQLATRQLFRHIASLSNIFWYRLAMVIMLTCLTLSAPRACAITITFNYDERDRPAFDPDGTELKRITQAAADIWDSYILDDRSYHFDLSWENLSGSTKGQHEDYLGWATNNILIDTKDQNGNLRNWFFDPTPFDNKEFGTMQQTLVSQVDPADIDAGFSGNPQGNLEVGFNGFASSGGPAAGKLDLLSVVLHEIGHDLGLSYNGPFEDYYDFNSATVGGRSLGVLQTGDYEINLDSVLMTDWASDSGGERRLPSATDILATYDESITAVPDGQGGIKVSSFQNYNLPRVDFIGAQSTSWHDTLNWIGGAVPDYDNQVFIRNGGSVNQTTGSSAAQSLLVSEGSSLFVKGNKLNVIGDTQLGDNIGRRGELHVGNLAGGFSNFQTDNLWVTAGLVNTITSTSSIDVNHQFGIGMFGTLMGAGTVRVGEKLVNNGQINGGTFLLLGVGGTLTIGTSGVGATLDLDGTAPEHGQISATSGNLAIYGPLADDFNGSAVIGATRTMSFSQPWNMMGKLSMRGGADEANLATLAGADVTVGGTLDVTGKSLIMAPVILNNPAEVHLPDASDTLILAGPTTLRGGSFTGLGTLAVQGATSIAMPNPLFPDWPPVLNGNATAAMISDDSGTASQTNSLAATITKQTTNAFIPNQTTFALNVPLNVRSGGIVTATTSALYLSKPTTMSGGQITGSNTVNLVGDLIVDQNSTINPATFLWGDDNPAHRTTIRAGKRLDLTPNSIVRGGDVQEYRGHIVLESHSTLNVDLASTDTWTMAGSLELAPGSTVWGDKLLNTGNLVGDGSLAMTQVINAGFVSPGSPIGTMRVPSGQFKQTAEGSLGIQLAGLTPGSGFDVLSTRTASLGGRLAIELLPGFVPALGTQFDILTATGNGKFSIGNPITGVFDSLVLKAPDGIDFAGQLLYFPDHVSFQVTQFGLDPNNNSDFNGDGRVDANDLLVWQRSYSKDVLKPGVSKGDADSDGDVDGHDFLVWQRQINFRNPSQGRSLLTAVPEPSTLLLGLLALLAVPQRRLTSQRSHCATRHTA